jgi:hypothetical protein
MSRIDRCLPRQLGYGKFSHAVFAFLFCLTFLYLRSFHKYLSGLEDLIEHVSCCC